MSVYKILVLPMQHAIIPTDPIRALATWAIQELELIVQVLVKILFIRGKTMPC